MSFSVASIMVEGLQVIYRLVLDCYSEEKVLNNPKSTIPK